LVWAIIVHAAHQSDGVMAQSVVAPLVGYMHRMEKILADAAYEKQFMHLVEENLLGVELEISSKPPTAEGFVPVKRRWIGERTFGIFNFFRRLDKDHEKTTGGTAGVGSSVCLWNATFLLLLPSNQRMGKKILHGKYRQYTF
jgi:putative transposase